MGSGLVARLQDTPEFRAMWRDGVVCREIGRRLGGFSDSAVSLAARRYGYKPRKPRKRAKPIDATVLRALWSTGTSIEGIAAQLRCGKDRLHRRVAELGLPDRVPAPPAVPRDAMRARAMQCVKAVRPAYAPRTPFWNSVRDDAVIAAGGRYAANLALAEGWGISPSKVLARWHVLRVAA